MTRILPIKNAPDILLDDADFEALSQYTWRKAPHSDSIVTSFRDPETKKSKGLALGRALVPDAPHLALVIPKNGDPTDYRRENLLVVTRGDFSRFNARVNQKSKSGYSGIGSQNGRYTPGIEIGGVSFYFGTYSDSSRMGMYQGLELAARIYDWALITLLARPALNFPGETPSFPVGFVEKLEGKVRGTLVRQGLDPVLDYPDPYKRVVAQTI